MVTSNPIRSKSRWGETSVVILEPSYGHSQLILGNPLESAGLHLKVFHLDRHGKQTALMNHEHFDASIDPPSALAAVRSSVQGDCCVEQDERLIEDSV